MTVFKSFTYTRNEKTAQKAVFSSQVDVNWITRQGKSCADSIVRYGEYVKIRTQRERQTIKKPPRLRIVKRRGSYVTYSIAANHRIIQENKHSSQYQFVF